MGRLANVARRGVIWGMASGLLPSTSSSAKPQADHEAIDASALVVKEERVRSDLAAQVSTEADEVAFETYVAISDVDQQHRLRRLCELPTRTVEGWRAKARALAAHEPGCLEGTRDVSDIAAELIASLLADILNDTESLA